MEQKSCNMKESSIEITDKAYLIKLHKDEFEYSLVRKFLNKLLSGNIHQDGEFFDEGDLANKYPSELGERFDFLADK